MSNDAGMQASELERMFHQKIPITRAMGVSVAGWDGDGLRLTAPLKPNHNHLGTAFGGSLAAIATLAGYGLVWLELDDSGAHVVVRDAAIRYRKPVRDEIRALARRPERGVLDSFREAFAREGRARIALEVSVEGDGGPSVEFTGTFVALR
jgi:thioesterase domain, putative